MSHHEKRDMLLNSLNKLSESIKDLNKFIANQGQEAYLGLAEKVHKTNLDATGREKW